MFQTASTSLNSLLEQDLVRFLIGQFYNLILDISFFVRFVYYSSQWWHVIYSSGNREKGKEEDGGGGRWR